MANDIQLKPCPFCGGKAVASGFYCGDEVYGAASCSLCKANIEIVRNAFDPDCPSNADERLKAAAANAWNRRVGKEA